MITIKKDSKDFHKIKLLSGYVSKDIYRLNMSVIRCEDTVLIATDGRQLMTLKLDSLVQHSDFENNKSYEVIKNDSTSIILSIKETENQFPNWRRVIPEEDSYSLVYEQVSIANKENAISIVSRIFAILVKSIEDSVTVNFSYLMNVIHNKARLCFNFYTDKTSGSKPIIIKDNEDTLKIIIMPMTMAI